MKSTIEQSLENRATPPPDSSGGESPQEYRAITSVQENTKDDKNVSFKSFETITTDVLTSTDIAVLREQMQNNPPMFYNEEALKDFISGLLPHISPEHVPSAERDIMAIWLEEFVIRVEQTSQKINRHYDEVALEELEYFIDEEVAERMFMGPLSEGERSLFEKISASNALKIFTRAQRLERIQHSDLGPFLLDTLLTCLASITDTERNEILQKLKEAPPSFILDVIHQLSAVRARALASSQAAMYSESGQDDSNEDKKIIETCDYLFEGMQQDASPIVMRAIHVALQQSVTAAKKPEYHRTQLGIDNISRPHEEPTAAMHEWHSRLYTLLKKQLKHIPVSNNIEESRHRLAPIARNAIALFDGTNVPRFYMNLGHTSVDNVTEDVLQTVTLQPFDTFDDSHPSDALLLSHLHRPVLREDIEKDLGIACTDLSLRSQMHLLTYLSTKDRKGFDSVREAIRGYSGDKSEFLNAFLALRYGEQHGDTIVRLAQELQPDLTVELFAEYSQTLQKLERLRSTVKTHFDKDDDTNILHQFPQQLEEALIRRTSDIFLAMDYHLKRREQLDARASIDSLKAINLLLDILLDLPNQRQFEATKLLTGPHDNNNTDERLHQFFITDTSSGNQYHLRSFMRPHNADAGEARMSITLSFSGHGITQENASLQKLFLQSIENKQRKRKRSLSELSVRLDRDTHYDPPRLSLDLGRNKHEDATMRRSGDVLGNLLHATSELGAHNVKSFDPRYAHEETFAELASELDSFFSKISSGSAS